VRRYWKGHYLRALGGAAIEAFLARGQADGEDRDAALLPSGSLQGYGGAIATVDDDATAFSHRDALVEFVGVAGWTPGICAPVGRIPSPCPFRSTSPDATWGMAPSRSSSSASPTASMTATSSCSV
jgi:hypothetical protein